MKLSEKQLTSLQKSYMHTLRDRLTGLQRLGEVSYESELDGLSVICLNGHEITLVAHLALMGEEFNVTEKVIGAKVKSVQTMMKRLDDAGDSLTRAMLNELKLRETELGVRDERADAGEDPEHDS